MDTPFGFDFTSLNLITLISLGSFALLFFLQYLSPRRSLGTSGTNRIVQNLILFSLNSVLMRVFVPITLVASAQWAMQNGWGLLNLVQFDAWVAVLACLVLLDFAVYWQHVVTHKVPLLWRMHKVHHADHDMDVSTAIRFHPLELLLSLLFKVILVVLLGAPIAAVLIFELLLFIGPAFNHSNLRLPTWLDAKLRWVLVTPDVHRTHHSVLIAEQNANYGFLLICWDKLFNSYTLQPAAGHTDMQIGISSIGRSCERVDKMLVAPFLAENTAEPGGN